MSLDQENWILLQELFELADVTPAADRERVLLARCGDRAIVQRALAILDGAATAEQQTTPKEPSLPCVRIGPYTLLRVLGCGGIGTVYLAERMMAGTPRRTALKVLAPQAAGPAFIERFHREQHILGSLDHPHITRMLDAGIQETGQPYLVMEYVDGEPLDVYCDQKKLSIRQRIELFLQICEAISYAHRNLVVHLDLKPTNIFVTHDGEVKLLDFGTSKLMRPDALLTTTVMATPAYASPEQLRNEPVTTACDIYSLGAVLYELLCGARPFDSSSQFLDHAFLEREARPVSEPVTQQAADHRQLSEVKLRQALSGDLTIIISKCLRPRAKDRYVSVDTFAEDLRRYLDGRSVLARPQTIVYRAGKFVRRNRLSLSVSLVLLAFLTVTLLYAERRQRQALEEGRRAEQMQSFMDSLFAAANSEHFGKPTLSIDEFLQLGIDTLPSYMHNPEDLRKALNRLAVSLFENDDFKRAQPVFERTLHEAIAAHDLDGQAESLAYLGDIAFRFGDLEKGMKLSAEALHLSSNRAVTPLTRVTAEHIYAVNREVNGVQTGENLRIFNQAIQEARESHLPARKQARVVESLGSVLTQRNDLDQATAAYQQALSLYRQDAAFPCRAATVEAQLGTIERMRGEFQQSLAHHQEALSSIIRCTGPESPTTLYAERLVGQDLIWLGRGPEAVAVMEPDVAANRERDAGKGGPTLSKALHTLAEAYLITGHPEKAEKLVREEIKFATGKLPPHSLGVGVIDLLLAQSLAAQNRKREALPVAQEAVRSLGPALPNSPFTDRARQDRARQLLSSLETPQH